MGELAETTRVGVEVGDGEGGDARLEALIRGDREEPSGATASLTTTADPTPSGLPDSGERHRFPLDTLAPDIVTEGGAVTKCNETNFPILAGNDAAIYRLVLKPGALREPHWHPNAWEFDYCVSGIGRLGIVAPDGTRRTVELEPGDAAFIPQGWLHFIDNAGAQELKLVVTFNSSKPSDIGLSTAFGGVPTRVFSETLRLPSDGLADAEKPDATFFIVP